MYNDYGDNMLEEIKLGDIKKFQEKYINNNENEKIQESIMKDGLEKTCFNKELQEKYKYRFNIQIPEIKMYN